MASVDDNNSNDVISRQINDNHSTSTFSTSSAPASSISPSAPSNSIDPSSSSSSSSPPPSSPLRLADYLTIVITTSPVPSNPSTSMIESIFCNSFPLIDGLQQCHKIIVCDGYISRPTSSTSSDATSAAASTPVREWGTFEQYKAGIVSSTAAHDYNQFIANVRHLIASHPQFHNTRMVVQSSRNGFAENVRMMLDPSLSPDVHVTTPYVFVYQHDWRIFRSLDFTHIIRVMEQYANEINYVGFVSSPTKNYINKMYTMAKKLYQDLVILTTPSSSLSLPSSSSSSSAATAATDANHITTNGTSLTATTASSTSTATSSSSSTFTRSDPNGVIDDENSECKHSDDNGNDNGGSSSVNSSSVDGNGSWTDDSPEFAAALARIPSGSNKLHTIEKNMIDYYTQRYTIPLIPHPFWYDKPHIARVSYYNNYVFGQSHWSYAHRACVRVKNFIEDTFGHIELDDVKTYGLSVHATKYKNFLYYDDTPSKSIFIGHEHGRRVHLSHERIEYFKQQSQRKRDAERDAERAHTRALYERAGIQTTERAPTTDSSDDDDDDDGLLASCFTNAEAES